MPSTAGRLARSAALFLGIALVLCATQTGLAASAPFNDIIAFGDSLTDVGNVAGLTEAGVAPVIEGYYKETHFCDNVLWVETLAEYWGLPARTPGRGSSTTLPPRRRGNTWAWGGAEAASGTVQPAGVTEPIPNLLRQVQQYLIHNTPQRKTLYAIWAGADNLLVGGKFGPKAAAAAVAVVETAMSRLEKAGARHLLVFNMPKMGDTPEAQSGGAIAVAAANLYSVSYNASLSATIGKLRRNPRFRAKIYVVDVYKELVSIVATVKGGRTYTPGFFVPGGPVSIDNVTALGRDYFDETGTFPTTYLLWDDVHPTRQGHRIVAGLALRAVSGKPH